MNAERIAAELYDHTVPDWPGEIRFYEAKAVKARTILEVACGTGRVGLRLAQAGRHVMGFDISPHMIAIATAKRQHNPDAEWRLGDMRSFELGRRFDLVIIPGHSFQFMLAIPDQLACLNTLRQHVERNGRLVVHVDHQDLAWLGSLPAEAPGAAEVASEVQFPDGRAIRVSRRWPYDRVTQTASSASTYEELNEGKAVIARADRAPVQLHCFFRNEMELLWRQAGFEVQGLYGDFVESRLGNESTEKVWVLRVPAP